MTTEGDGQDAGAAVPRCQDALASTDDGTAALDRDTLEQLTSNVTGEVGTAADGALAITEGSGELFRNLVDHAVAPQFAETIRRTQEIFAGSAYKSIVESNALMRAPQLNGFAEVLARVTADRAAVSLASGLRASDVVTSVIAKAMADTQGFGMAKSAIAATVGKYLEGFSTGLPSSTLAALTKGLDPKVDLAGFHTALRQSQAFRSILNKHAGAEIARTRGLAIHQIVTTSGIAELIGSGKMIASWRQSLLSEATARSLIGTITVPEAGVSLLRDIVAANTATARVVGRHIELNKASVLAPAISARPTRELRSFLTGMSVAPDLDKLTFAVRASRSVAGIAAADLLVADTIIEDEAGELFEAEIVEPWLDGPEALRGLLFSRLGALDPHVPDLLRGAWAQVEQDGPAATSMASHAVQEAIDRTLRALAPSDLVLRLVTAGILPKNSVYEKNGERQPTRAGRIAAALHERQPGETKLIAAQAKAIAASVGYLTESLQRGKHASKGTVGLVRTWLVSVEATFTQLLYEPGDG